MQDHELLLSTKTLVSRERELTTEVLRHFTEIERRKLYCDVTRPGDGGLKYGSLFEYAVHELGYSEAAASRRIQAMRLVNEMPEVEQKIQSGALSLSNISQAQVFFREIKRAEPTRVVSREEKAAVLAQLEQKSAREAERVLITLSPAEALPRERVRQIDLEHTELRFVVSAELKGKLQVVRSLMGTRGGSLSLAELVSEMAAISARHLAEKKFGKRRVEAEVQGKVTASREASPVAVSKGATSDVGTGDKTHPAAKPSPFTSDVGTSGKAQPVVTQNSLFTSDVGTSTRAQLAVTHNTRYIPPSVKHAVWRVARGKCAACGAQHNLQIDHIRPVALGGDSTPDNLQLLCGSCNLRRGVKTFGLTAVRRR